MGINTKKKKEQVLINALEKVFQSKKKRKGNRVKFSISYRKL